MNARIIFAVAACALALAGFGAYSVGPVMTNDYHGVKAIVNYDKSRIVPYTLEDPLAFIDGRKVATVADWDARRREILDIFAKEMYGAEPPKPVVLVTDLVREKVTCDGYAIRRQYAMWFRSDRTGPCISSLRRLHRDPYSSRA